MSHSNTNLLQEQMITYQTIVGIIFLVVSFFASCTNMAACLAIISSKDLRGSFYIFSFNAIFGDLISLIGIGFFIGLTLVLDSTFGQAGQRIFGMLADLGWFCKDVFMILVCLTRLIILSKMHKNANNKHPFFVNFVSFFVWSFYVLACSTYLFADHSVYYEDLSTISWEYDLSGNNSSVVAIIANTYNYYHNKTVAIALLVVNLATLVVVRRKLKKINLVSESSPPSNTAANADMRRREIKLFLQSFVSSAIHLTGAFVPLFVPDNTATRLFRYIWSLVNLCDYGAVLLIMNKDIRSKIILGVKTFKVKVISGSW